MIFLIQIADAEGVILDGHIRTSYPLNCREFGYDYYVLIFLNIVGFVVAVLSVVQQLFGSSIYRMLLYYFQLLFVIILMSNQGARTNSALTSEK